MNTIQIGIIVIYLSVVGALVTVGTHNNIPLGVAASFGLLAVCYTIMWTGKHLLDSINSLKQ
ncbi:MAG: hypothetical protein JWN64_217 [Parcubacteria group bacterium]|nr:hypothetical protein [Parcubacteria group bacterium]